MAEDLSSRKCHWSSAILSRRVRRIIQKSYHILTGVLYSMQEPMWQSGEIFKKQQISITESKQVVNDLNAVTNKVAVSIFSVCDVGTDATSDLTCFLFRL